MGTWHYLFQNLKNRIQSQTKQIIEASSQGDLWWQQWAGHCCHSGTQWFCKLMQRCWYSTLQQLWCIMKISRWSHIKVSRSKPLSSLSLSFQSNNDPFMSRHYSDSARLPKQVIQSFNLTVSCWSGLFTPHSFLLPLLLEEKTQRQGICLTVGSCFMCSVWKKKRVSLLCVCVTWWDFAKRARSPLEEHWVLELDDLFGEAL